MKKTVKGICNFFPTAIYAQERCAWAIPGNVTIEIHEYIISSDKLIQICLTLKNNFSKVWHNQTTSIAQTYRRNIMPFRKFKRNCWRSFGESFEKANLAVNGRLPCFTVPSKKIITSWILMIAFWYFIPWLGNVKRLLYQNCKRTGVLFYFLKPHVLNILVLRSDIYSSK